MVTFFLFWVLMEERFFKQKRRLERGIKFWWFISKLYNHFFDIRIYFFIFSLYACIKVKTKEDFDRLTEMLYNARINGTKLTSIPITKIADSSEMLSTSD